MESNSYKWTLSGRGLLATVAAGYFGGFLCAALVVLAAAQKEPD